MDVVGETGFPINGVIQQDRIAIALVERSLDDGVLRVDAFGGHGFERGRVIKSAENGEAMLLEKGIQFIQLICAKHADICVEADDSDHISVSSFDLIFRSFNG